MSDTRIAPTVDRADGATDELDHLYCCDPDTALCGTDISDSPELFDDGETTCVVCVDLADAGCPQCGFTPA
ncbi:hypothetical protein [Streptomyces virginiae]